MTTGDFCPYCLTELPDDYPFDHVAIDRVLAGDRRPLARMGGDERRELVLYARGAGMSDYAISTRLGCSVISVDNIATGHQIRRRCSPRGAHDQDIRLLWSDGLSDRAIARRLRMDSANVWRIRTRLRLPANHSVTVQIVHHQEAA